MSFQEEKRESIKRYMLEKIRQEDEEFIQKTMDNFQISITTVKRYIKECLECGILSEDERGKSSYKLTSKKYVFEYENNGQLKEDIIYFENIAPLLGEVSKEATSIWAYSFMEMMNNAIEHSSASHIRCIVKKDYLYTEISIADNGIGIFKNVKQFLENTLEREISYQDVLAELYKGKLTTCEQNHSGEGIFFTSKVLTEFAIWSDNAILSYKCLDKEKFVKSHLISYYNRLNQIGTMVTMKLENNTTRKIGEVFDMFAPIDEGFVRTRIPIKEVCPYGEPIARSQARRIVHRLEEFKQVELDFEGIDFMGQGFADEIFRVFQNEHPEVELIPMNACRSVLGMIKHVTV